MKRELRRRSAPAGRPTRELRRPVRAARAASRTVAWWLLAVAAVGPLACHRAGGLRPAMVPPPERAQPLPRRGTVVLLGDSITWHNDYVVLLQAYFHQRLPRRRLLFVNRGVRGDTVPGAVARLERDVLPHQPAVVIVLLGMNDGGYRPLHRRLVRRYAQQSEQLVRAIRSRSRARVVLVTPPPVAPQSYDRRAYNEMLAAMATALVELGRRLRVTVIDLQPIFVRAMRDAGRADPALRLMRDAVHPAPAGHVLIAAALLAQLVPDAAPPAAVRRRLSAQAREALLGGRSVPITLVHPHDALYVPPGASGAWRLLPVQQRYGHRWLIIEQVPRAVRLRVEQGPVLGTFTPGQLARGVDLDGLDAAPWSRAAARLHRLLWQRWRLDYVRWDPEQRGAAAAQDVGLDASNPHRPQRLKQALRAVDAELRDDVRPRPQTHRLVLEPLQ